MGGVGRWDLHSRSSAVDLWSKDDADRQEHGLCLSWISYSKVDFAKRSGHVIGPTRYTIQ